MAYVSKKRSSAINSWRLGQYHATAFAEPSTCNAYSKANTGSGACIGQSGFFRSTVIPESTLKLTGPTICKIHIKGVLVNIMASIKNQMLEQFCSARFESQDKKSTDRKTEDKATRGRIARLNKEI